MKPCFEIPPPPWRLFRFNRVLTAQQMGDLAYQPTTKGTPMTEPITHDEVIDVALALSTATDLIVAGLQTIADGQVGDGWGGDDIQRLRQTADLIDLHVGAAGAANTLRRAADQVDPSVPVEPDLTTPEGWFAEAGSVNFAYKDVALPKTPEQLSALRLAWATADTQSNAEACFANLLVWYEYNQRSKK